jgi:hypothetical protein
MRRFFFVIAGLSFVLPACALETTRVGGDIPGPDARAPEALSLGNCVRMASGTVACGVDGVPVEVDGLSDVLGVASGVLSGKCARLADGRAACWGSPLRGAGGTLDPRTAIRIAPGIVDVAQLTMNNRQVCGLTVDGHVQCWDVASWAATGTDLVHEPGRGAKVAGARRLASGDAQHCVLTERGTVHCTGGNDSGQLGDGTTTSRDTWAEVPGLLDVVALSAAGEATCAVRGDGSVACWGIDLGVLSPLPDEAFVPCKREATRRCALAPTTIPGLSEVREISVDGGYACALGMDGTAVCWGDQQDMRPLPLSGILQVSTSCALVEGGDVYCWGQDGEPVKSEVNVNRSPNDPA